jgi:hypothetical protein
MSAASRSMLSTAGVCMLASSALSLPFNRCWGRKRASARPIGTDTGAAITRNATGGEWLQYCSCR